VGPQTWNWQRITLFSLLLITAFIVATVPDHYLKEHIWEHIVKKTSMAGISLDFFRAAFHHLWTSILGFRRFCQGKYDIDISDLRACGNNT
jgi:hypothetical protein